MNTFLNTAKAVHELLSEERSYSEDDRQIVKEFIEELKRKPRTEITSFTSSLHEDDSPEGRLRRSRIYNYGGVIFWELESFAVDGTYSLPPYGSEKREACVAFLEAWSLFAKWKEEAHRKAAVFRGRASHG